MRLIAALLAVLPALAQSTLAQSTKVVPNHLATVEGNSQTTDPVGPNAGKYQQIISGAQVATTSATIQGLTLRLDGGLNQGFLGRGFASFLVRLGYASLPPAAMTRSFATNVSGTLTTVYSGSWQLPAQLPSTARPMPFNIPIPFRAPWTYTRAQGDLLLEIEVPGRPQFNMYYPIDAEVGGGAAKVESYGNAGTLSAGSYAFAQSAAGLRPGGNLVLSLSSVATNWPALVTIGLSRTTHGPLPLPFDLTPLGAPGNELLASIDLTLPVAWTLVFTQWIGAVSMPLPNDPRLAGLRLFEQALMIDPQANALGIVFSHGIATTLEGPKTGPIQMIHSRQPTSATGEYVFGTAAGGIVIELNGTFQ